MTRQKIAQWAFENVTERYSYDEIGEMYAENGLRGIENAVLVRFADEFRDESDTRACSGRDCYVDAFNEVARDWNYRVRPLLAEYLATDSYDYNQQFEDELMQFAEGEQMRLEDRDSVQVTLSATFQPNPFNDPSLSESEATGVLAARMAGYDDTEYDVENIGDGEAFAERLFDSNDLQYAINASHFDGLLPDGMIGDVAEPQNWENDPADIDHTTCVNCGNDFYEVTTASGDVEYMSEHGEFLHHESISDRDDLYAPEGNSSGDAVCERCYEPNTQREVYIISPDGIAQLNVKRAVATDVGADEQELISAASLSDDLSSMATNVGFRSFDDDDLLQLNPSDAPIDSGTVRRRIESAVESPDDVEYDYDEAIVVEYTENYAGENYYVYADRSNWDQCRAAKEFMQELSA